MKNRDSQKPVAADAAVMTVDDAVGRRRFLLAGSGLLLAGGMALASRDTLAADCDHGGGGGNGAKAPKQAQSGSDSDEGAAADPAGCGRRRNDTPKISRADDPLPPGSTSVRVARIVRS